MYNTFVALLSIIAKEENQTELRCSFHETLRNIHAEFVHFFTTGELDAVEMMATS